jgi:glycosyltransferase involved in cell wall biosynthesis
MPKKTAAAVSKTENRVLSIVIPAYNEEKTLETIVRKVVTFTLPDGWSKEIVILNDCSKDSTSKIIKKLAKEFPFIKGIDNKINLGKTQTVRKGILASTGDFVVIQDADLEYDPQDLGYMFEQLLRHQCDVAYGNRFGKYNGVIYWKNFLGNLLLSFFSNMFTVWHIRVSIPDMEVCYKMMRGDVARDIAQTISAKSNFGLEPEITAKLAKYRINGNFLKFLILPISYLPRSIEEGKKMRAFRDGSKALWEILRFNLGK